MQKQSEQTTAVARMVLEMPMVAAVAVSVTGIAIAICMTVVTFYVPGIAAKTLSVFYLMAGMFAAAGTSAIFRLLSRREDADLSDEEMYLQDESRALASLKDLAGKMDDPQLPLALD